MSDLTIDFKKDEIYFHDYPFCLGRLQSSNRIHASEILAIRPQTAPPAIFLKQQEVLFTHASQRSDLIQWCRLHQISELSQWDTWSWICEPFLDTVFTSDDESRCLKHLENAKISPKEVQAIRKQIKPYLLAYNSVLWDWTDLGHYDLLCAKRDFGGGLDPTFYFWTMQMAYGKQNEVTSKTSG